MKIISSGILWIIFAASSAVPPPAHASHLEWVQRAGIGGGVIEACDDCTSGEITLPTQFPFGPRTESSIYVSTNGAISFAPMNSSSDADRHRIVAVYWVDNERLNGNVSWEMYRIGYSLQSNKIINRVKSFIRTNSNSPNFGGNFVFVANWSEMHQYPAGDSAVDALTMNNSYQAVLVTDGRKSFAIFTFKCGMMNWAATTPSIGFNAGGRYFADHPLSQQPFSNTIACLNEESEWSNVVYDLTSTENEGYGLGPEVVFCSPHSNCIASSAATTAASCCGKPGVYTYNRTNSQCQLCFEYGWVQSITGDRQSAVPLTEVHVTEGDSINLSIYFLQNGPSHRDYINFVITSSGSATNNVDYSLVHVRPLQLTNQPVVVNVQTTNDDIYEGTEKVTLTLVQSFTSNVVTTDRGLVSRNVAITLQDNDQVTIRFTQTTMTVMEDVGNIVLFATILGETALPISVGISITGTAFNTQDFVFSKSTLRFNSSKTQDDIVLRIIDDDVIESTENLAISLTNPNPPDAVAALGSTRITIINNDFPHIGFEQTLYTASEVVGSINICISVRTGPVIDRLRIQIYVRSNSAQDDDFRLSGNPTIVKIPSRARRGCLTITIIHSVLVERDEEIHLSISEEILAVIEEPATTVVIKEGRFVVLGFDQESYTINEGGLLKLTVSKSLPCNFDIHFRVHVDGLIHEERIFQSAENKTVISVTLPDDEVALEPDENYVLTLSLVIPDPQVELGSHLSNLTITDNENTVTVGFDGLREINVTEDIGSVEVSVSLRNDVAVPISVDIAVINGTAMKGQDFNVLGSLHHTFANKGTQSFSVKIVDDSKIEEEETFSLSLVKAYPSDAVQFDPAILNVTIVDNESRESSSLSANYLLLLPVVVLLMVVVVAVVVTACCCIRRRRRKHLKTSSLQCSYPFSGQNDYGMAPTVRNKRAPQSNAKDETKFSNVMGTAVLVLPPIECQSRQKPSVCVPARAAPPPPDRKKCVVNNKSSHVTKQECHKKPQRVPSNVSKPQSYREPSVCVSARAAPPPPDQKSSGIDKSGRVTKQECHKKPQRVPSNVSKPQSYHEARADVPEAGAKHTCGPKPKVSMSSSVVKPQCNKNPTGSAPSSLAQPEDKQKPLPALFHSHQKPSVSAPSCSTEPPSNKMPSMSTPTSGAEPKCNAVANYKNIEIFLLPKPGVDDEPEVKANVAYRCIAIPSSEYDIPQQLREQQRARNALLPSEMQAVEAYAISTISKKL